MGLLDSILGGIGGLSAIGGLIGANQARDQAMQQQQQALNQYAQAMDSQYQAMLQNNNRTLMGMAGQGGDAIRNLGANLGSSMAGAGVYNSSATAGALAQAQRDENTSLSNLAAQNYYSANQLFNQGQANLAQMRLGQANTNYGYANQNLYGAEQGLGSFLGSLTQSNLMRSGANMAQTQLPPGPRAQNLGANLGGSTGGIGNGGGSLMGNSLGGSALPIGATGLLGNAQLSSGYPSVGAGPLLNPQPGPGWQTWSQHVASAFPDPGSPQGR